MREDAFERHVRDALVYFYDPTHLQTHPLVELLHLSSTVGQTAAESLRTLLRETIETLRPPAIIPLDRPEWLNYRLLWARYVQSLSQAETCQELGLSQATYYRRHQEALQAVASILWARHCQEHAPADEPRTDPPETPPDQTPRERACQQAIQLATSSPRETVCLGALFRGICQMMVPVLRAQGLALHVDAPPALPTIQADPAVLRQILIGTLNEGIRRASESTLQLHIHTEKGALVWRLGPLQEHPPRQTPDANANSDLGLAICEALLEAYGGRLWSTTDQGACTLVGMLPITQASTILIVDDDGDAIQLYQRYLADEKYTIRVAQHGNELEQLLHDDLPDLILLDVLMPKWDGWAILQRLRTLPKRRTSR
ncbi:MAG: response regulator [Chloroflexi bacterium]|nr:response regulator [Chloroflexota bacterium]